MNQAVTTNAGIDPAPGSVPTARPGREWFEPLLDRGLIPDAVLRAAIRGQLRERLRHEGRGGPAAAEARKGVLIEELSRAPVAIHTREANEQHYELPPAFFELCLGPRCKYSSGLWPAGARTLAHAEEAMLALTCERAGIRDGDRVLELGCGWGSLTLWMAEKFPRCAITAVSNSRPQREFILSRARAMGLREPTVITADANAFDTPDRFERIVSVEMFEHMKNYRALMSRVASWLTPGGRLFVHVFAHATLAYHFETDDWMGRYFFTGGTMPSHDLLPRFAGELRTAGQWAIDGTHYAKTARAWLDNLDARRDRALGVLARAYGEHAPRWLHRWRVFFMACEELWNFRGGKEWIVSHSVFDKPG